MLSRIIEVENLTEMWHKIGGLFLKEEKSLRGGVDHFLYLHDIIIESKNSLAPVLCLEDVGYTSRKIMHLLRSYIDPEDINNCLKDIKDTSEKWRLGTIFIDHSIPIKKKSSHIKGSCILGASYKGFGKPTLTVYSRSIEFPKKALADIFLVSSLALIIKERLDIKEDINIIWHIGSIWIRARIGARLYRIYRLPLETKYKNNNFQKCVQKGWDKFIVNQGKVSWNGLKRVQKLYLAKKNKIMERVIGSEKFLKVFKNYLGI